MPDRQRPSSGGGPSSRPRARPSGGARPSSATFRRRRLTVLVAGLVVLGLIAWGVVALAGGGGDPSSSSSSTAQPTTTTGGATPDPEVAGGEPTASPAASSEPRPRVSDVAIGATPPPPTGCPADWAELSVTAPDSTPGGQVVPATIHVITGPDGDPCLVDLGSEALTVDVYSGEERVWSSAECPFNPASRPLLLPPDAMDVAEVRWSGYRAAGGCGSDESAAVEPGTYRFVVTHTLDGQTLTAETTFLVG